MSETIQEKLSKVEGELSEIKEILIQIKGLIKEVTSEESLARVFVQVVGENEN